MLPKSDFNISQQFSNELMTGEKVIWAGKPTNPPLFINYDLFIIPFTFLWLSVPISILFSNSDESSTVALPIMIFPYIFMIMGLYLLVGRFIYKRWMQARTRYALTDRRAMSLEPSIFGGESLRTADLKQTNQISKKTMKSGRGSIAFGGRSGIIGIYANSGLDLFTLGASAGIVEFYSISDLDGVYRLAIESKDSLR
ncbi:hypothetical protein JYU04_01760 [Dehalococcoides mccartyi]|nr:hypothetical protein [Dehalococcoides mccartyi]